MTFRIFLDNVIVWAPSVLHFKGLGIRNLQYEMSICQKSHNKVTDSLCMVQIFIDQTLQFKICPAN